MSIVMANDGIYAWPVPPRPLCNIIRCECYAEICDKLFGAGTVELSIVSILRLDLA